MVMARSSCLCPMVGVRRMLEALLGCIQNGNGFSDLNGWLRG
ncbi:hypothetical protein ABH909_004590 [Pseudomonas sp. BS3782 TE3695]|jgi:hypothetical protein